MDTCTVEVFYDGVRVTKPIEMFFSERILEDVFAGFNWGSMQELPEFRAAKIRSMMPGDCVIITMENGHKTGWSCESRGWDRLEAV